MLSQGGRIRREFYQFARSKRSIASAIPTQELAPEPSPFHRIRATFYGPSSQHNRQSSPHARSPSMHSASLEEEKNKRKKEKEAAKELARRRQHKKQYFQIRDHVAAKRYAAARDFWIASGFRPTIRVEYNLLLQALVKLGAHGHCLALFDEMKHRARIVPDAVTFATVMGVYLPAPRSAPPEYDPQAGHDTVDWIEMDDLDADVDGHIQMNSNEAAFCRLYDEMKLFGVAPDQVIYDMLLAMYSKDTTNRICRSSSLPRPWDIIGQMRVEGIEPTIRSYNYLLMVYGGIARRKIYYYRKENDFRLPGEGLTGGIQSFETIGIDIGGEKLSRESEEVLKFTLTYPELDESVEILCREMRTLGIQFNAVTYTALIDFYATRNLVHQVVETFNRMKTDGVMPNLVTYNILLTYYRRTRRDDHAVLELCREMMANGLNPDAFTFATVCSMFTAAAETTQRRKLRLHKKRKKLSSKERKPNPFAPPTFAANTIRNTSAAEAITESARILNATDEHLTAKDLLLFYRQMKATGMQPNIVTYNTLLDAFYKLRDIPSMHLLLTDMGRENVSRDVRTFNLFLRMYMFSSAIRLRHRKLFVQVLLDEMSCAGVAPDSVTIVLRRKFSRTCARREQTRQKRLMSIPKNATKLKAWSATISNRE